MCGEKVQLYRIDKTEIGSPPHVRGKADAAAHWFLAQGITPACAGKSGFVPNSYSSERDHPRMCGEKTKKIP